MDAVRIADMPRLRYRGVLLDVARNFQSPRTVKKLLDLMAFYKLNRLHWHLTDDEGWRIEIQALPELTEVGGRRGHTLDDVEHLMPSHGSGPFATPAGEGGSGFYTQDEVIEILRYAAARQITVIPEIDLPGHARAAIKAMEARRRKLLAGGEAAAADEFLLREPGDPSQYQSAQLRNDNVADVGRDAIYRFLRVVVDELAEVYRRAEVPLACIHLGGDEVPAGAWEKSSACAAIPSDANSTLPHRGQLELYFLNRAREILVQRSIQSACWEDCLLVEVDNDSAAANKERAAGQSPPTAYVWNNVWGAGREDSAYRLANAGFDVVLCNATHLYFDLACEKDTAELGHHWAGFVGTRAAFELVPLEFFKNVDKDSMGRPINQASIAACARLTAEGQRHIVGIQGQLWAENLRIRGRLGVHGVSAARWRWPSGPGRGRPPGPMSPTGRAPAANRPRLESIRQPIGAAGIAAARLFAGWRRLSTAAAGGRGARRTAPRELRAARASDPLHDRRPRADGERQSVQCAAAI